MNGTLKVLSWNLGHRTREVPVPSEVVTVVAALGADVVFFNEFVDGASRADLRLGLADLGLIHQDASDRFERSNQIFVAASSAFTRGSLRSPGTTPVADANWLHLRLPDAGIDLVGLRIPSYETAAQRASYRSALAQLLRSETDQPLVLCGDFNLDPFKGVPAGVANVPLLGVDEFVVPRPAGGWSFVNAAGTVHSAIDHVAHTSRVTVSNATYHHTVGAVVLAGAHEQNPISDHAPLTFDVGLP